MASRVIDEKSFIVSTDVGLVQTKIKTVSGYDIEDLAQDRSLSQALTIKFVNLGKRIDPNSPKGARTIPSIWKNNENRLPD